MLKWIVALLAIAAGAAFGSEGVIYEQVNPLVEVRAVWVNSDAIPKTDAGIRDLVRSYHKANINVLMPEVIARGYVAYPTKLLARDPRFVGAVDPLPPMIDEAHKLGMEVHPWVWVFRVGYTKDRGAILTAHPDWANQSKYGEELSPNGGLWIDPTIPEARDFLASLFAELVNNYEVDGIHLDYIRYEVESPIPYGYGQSARSLFNKQYGIDPVNIDRLTLDQVFWNKFRERQVNTFVQRIALQTHAIKPEAKISAAVGSSPDEARMNLMQNWVNWADNKWVDFLTPMAYTNNNTSFTRLVSQQQCAVKCKTLVVPGIGLHMQKDNPAQTVEQIGITRELLTSGQALFASSYFGEPQASALKSGPYALPASLPFRDTWEKSMLLCDRAVQARKEGDRRLETHFAAQSDALACYAQYREQDTPYMPPTKPPLNIPENVIPLPAVDISKTASPITIDGNLDDPGWKSAAQIELSYTPNGGPAPVRTTALLTYDDTNVYIGFNATEPLADKIKATVTKRDGPTFYDDSVEVFVDPTDQRRTYYHLSTNTLGTMFDQKVFNPGWNGNWQTMSRVSAQGYTTEIAIPFKTLGANSPTPGTKWALNLTRNRTTTGTVEYITWAVPYGSFHSPDRFGTVVFR
ncbi:MAG: family 10 glycosylhydrolase [Armatimonadota bacterium]|nr:family 10 glycosylhydrolase [bacterium]